MVLRKLSLAIIQTFFPRWQWSWCYGYDPEMKQHSRQWESSSLPRPKNSSLSEIKRQSKADLFFDVRGVVHSKFVPRGQTINQVFYQEVLKTFHNSLLEKRPDLSQLGDWFFDLNNSPAYTTIPARQLLKEIGMIPVSRSLFTRPCPLWLFSVSPNERHEK